MHRVMWLAFAGIVLALPASPCAAKDIFNAIMRLKDGTIQHHYQTMTGARCDAALDAFREERKLGHEFVLTMRDPEVTGTVLEMACIRPDGTIWGPDGMVHLPDPPAR
jgi:hypothetical protein